MKDKLLNLLLAGLVTVTGWTLKTVVDLKSDVAARSALNIGLPPSNPY